MSVEVLKQIWPEWQIEGKPLGKGSFGVVYKAVRRDHGVESYAAIKVISIPTDPSEVDSLRSEGLDMNATRTYLQGIVNDFVSEIQLMESLKGVQNIVSVEDYKVVEKSSEIGWDIYIRMELLTSFNAYICDKKLTEEEVIKLGCNICTALEICAKRNIIHRDIKPENIFINDFGYFKLGDFGIARKMENMTGGLSQKGTFNYMAPEVANSSEYDARVDIYSLGIVLYRLLNGNRLPFLDTEKQLLNPNERRNAVDRRIRGEDLPAPCDASPAMADLILRACAYDPNMRFTSATEMKQALMSIANGTYQIGASNLDRTTSVRKAADSYDRTTSVRKAPAAYNQKSVPAVSTFGSTSKKNKLPVIIAAVLVVAIFIGTGIFVVPKWINGNDNGDQSETSGESIPGKEDTNGDVSDLDLSYFNTYNAVNGGYIARNDELIFYISNNGSIIRMNSDGNERTVILEDLECSEVFLLGETLYFLSAKDRCIYTSDLEGANLKKIAEGNIGWFNITEEFIYYVDGYYEFVEETWEFIDHGDYYLYRINLDGTGLKRITHVATSNVNITEKEIVYLNIDENAIYSINLEGENPQVLYSGHEDDYLGNFVVYKENLYYTKTDYENDSVSGIYTISVNSKETNKIVATIPGSFTFWNDELIYVADSNSSDAKTYICSLSGDNQQAILSNSISSPIVLGDYLYYYDYDSDEGINIISYIDLNTFEQGAFEEKIFDDLICTDRYLFFIDKRDNNIYRSNLDGSNILKLTNAECRSLYYYNGNLYYEGYANGYDEEHSQTDSGIFPYGLFRLDENGLEATWIEGSVRYDVLFDEDYVYYPSIWDSNLYRTGLSEIEDLEEDPPFIRAYDNDDYGTPYLITDGWIYVRCDSGIVRIRLDGSSTQTIINGWASQLQLYNGKIYYIGTDDNSNSQLRRVNPDGTKNEIVIEEPIQKYILSDGVVYYIDSEYHYLYRINTDGTKKVLLADVASSDFVVRDEDIYYINKYDHGTIYLMKTDGNNPQQIVDVNCEATNSYDYKTKGVDDFAEKEENTPEINFSPTDVLSFEDPEFEQFLSVMFNKETGTITGADLLSVKFFGYYEGAPTEKSLLANYGTATSLFENCVFYSTNDLTGSVDVSGIMFDEAAGDTLTYRENCIKLGVISNEWMASHVMPYLHYFKNLEYVVFGYCWVSGDTCLPTGANQQSYNTHSRYFHDPY